MKIRDDEADDRMAGTPSALAYAPQLLAYPLRGFCLPVLLVVTVLIGVGSLGIQGVPILAIGTIWMVHYLLAVIERTAQGHATAPPLAGEVVFLDAWKTFKSLFLPLVIATAWAVLRGDSPGGAAAVLALGAFLMPAYLCALALDGEFIVAMNPLRWANVIGVMGAAYLLPCALLAAGGAAIGLLAGGGGLLVVLFATLYLLFATAHLVGFLAYHRHRQLGIDVHVGDPADKRKASEQAARLAALLDAIDQCLQANDLAGAARLIAQEPGGPANVRGFHEDLFERICTRGVPALVHAQGRRLVARLLDEKRDARALEVLETCENRHPGFEPASAEQWLRLAQQALAERLDRRFEALVDALAATHPAHEAAVSARLLKARWESEARGDDDAARALLAPLLAQRAHPQYPQIQALARALSQLRKPPAT